jgi:hypothetical protein
MSFVQSTHKMPTGTWNIIATFHHQQNTQVYPKGSHTLPTMKVLCIHNRSTKGSHYSRQHLWHTFFLSSSQQNYGGGMDHNDLLKGGILYAEAGIQP